MRFFTLIILLLVYRMTAFGQLPPAPESQSATIKGLVTDPDRNYISGAVVAVTGIKSSFGTEVTTDASGEFAVAGLDTADAYRVTVTSPGFADWTSPEIVLSSGQNYEFENIALKLSTVETTVSAVSVGQLALEQVKREETQRVFGVIPNFYVVYDKKAVPMQASLKFRLAMRVQTDVITFSGAALTAAMDQAADRTAFPQGAKGYGQRFGASYAGDATAILIGGAILPSLLHQDPRYFYSGEGTKGTRLAYALTSAFICHGDNGHLQFNYSGIGGDLASAALTNAYYPTSDRGAGLFLSNFGILMGGRVAYTIAEELLLRRFTTHAREY